MAATVMWVGAGESRASTGPTAYLVGGPYTLDIGEPLYSLDVTTGEATFIDEVTAADGGAPPHISGLALGPDGTLYAVSGFRDQTATDPELFRIDPETAVATRIATVSKNVSFAGLAFGAGGVLYVSSYDEDTFGSYFGTLDPSTGTVSVIQTYEGTQIPGLAARCSDQLLAVAGPSGYDPDATIPPYTLETIDPGSGARTSIGELATGTDISDPRPQLVFDQESGELWGAVTDRNEGGYENNADSVFTVDTTTGSVTPRPITEGGQPLHTEIQAMTFATASNCPATTPAPAPAPTPAPAVAQPVTAPVAADTLPRTGSSSSSGVVAGAALVGIGLVLVRLSRLRPDTA